MSLGIPFVSFDLIECKKASGEAALYAKDNNSKHLASQMARLFDDKDLAGALGEEGRARARQLLKWENEKARLLAAYELALSDKTKLAGRQAPHPVSG